MSRIGTRARKKAGATTENSTRPKTVTPIDFAIRPFGTTQSILTEKRSVIPAPRRCHPPYSECQDSRQCANRCKVGQGTSEMPRLPDHAIPSSVALELVEV
jgi:hypothetical protein